MKKVLLCLCIFLLCLVGFTGCGNPNDVDMQDPYSGVDNKPPIPSNDSDKEVNVPAAKLARSAWFSDDVEICFPYENETLYINYMPDSLNTEKWISLKENPNGTFTAKIEWSTNIREIGKTSETIITKKGATISVKSDFFNYSSMVSYEGVTASTFDPSKVPALKAEYLSNFSGEYNLKTTGYEVSVGAKLGISQDVNHYWNANVLNAIVREDGAYDMLLAHSSSNNGSGSIDPGITGNEPFITKQGLFWSHLVLTQEPGSKWNIEWSSVWYDSPYEALNADMDMVDSFTGPATTKITYKYNFYFGNPKLKESGYGVEAENAVLIKSDSFESDLPTSETWKDILKRAGTITVPEGKLADYWWYNTNSLSPLMESSVYKLTDSWEPALKEYDFYLALKDKPAAGDIYYHGQDTEKYICSNYTLIIESGYLKYSSDGENYTNYKIEGNKVYSYVRDTIPLQVIYLVSLNGENYFARIDYYINKGNSYIKLYPSLVTDKVSDTTYKTNIGDYTFGGKLKSFTIQ